MSEESLEKRNQGTSKLLHTTFENVVAGISGVAASKREDFILSVGHVLQKTRSTQFLSTLMSEWDKFVNKGKIAEGHEETEQHVSCLQEILDFIDKDLPDEIRFTNLKKVFLMSATERYSTRDSVLPQQYMRICRSLTSGQTLVLNATYAIAVEDWWKKEKPNSAKTWLDIIAKNSGLIFPELVEVHEAGLIEKNLLTVREYSDRSGIYPGNHFRMTELGFQLCEFISKYDLTFVDT